MTDLVQCCIYRQQIVDAQILGIACQAQCRRLYLSWAEFRTANELATVQEIDQFGRERVPKVAELAAMPYLDACWREALRLFPPGVVARREATKDFNLGGFHVPCSTTLLV